MDITRKNYADIPIIGPHHQAVRAGNLLFLAGTTAKMTDSEYGDMAEQTEAVLEIIKRILEAEGGSLDNVVKITNFVTDISKEATESSRDVRIRYFGDSLPASTRVKVSELVEPHLLIEIEAIAVLTD